MRAIQNEDVKSLSDLESRGGSKANLIHDTKIYVTAKGIQKTLSEIIESGEIADGNRFGADYKNYAIGMTDGSSEEYNMSVPYLEDGHTIIDLFFDVKELEVAQLHIGGEYYPKWISDAINPSKYWKWINESKIAVHGDLTGQARPISFVVFRGSEIPVVPSVFSGLKIENEAYAFTNSATGTNVTGVSVVDGKTHVYFSFDILPNDVPFVFIGNVFYPPYSSSIASTNKWFKRIGSNGIELGADLSSQSLSIYVGVFQGKSMIDRFGNMIVTLKPEIASFVIASPNGSKWNVASSVYGEIEVETTLSGNPIGVLLRNDDNEIVELTINNDGILSIGPQLQAGVLFDNINLSDIDGLIWELGATYDNILYTRSGGKNYYKIDRPNGNIIKQFNAMPNNAVLESTGYVDYDKLPELTELPNHSVTTTVVRRYDGTFTTMMWNTERQIWQEYNIASTSTDIPETNNIDWFSGSIFKKVLSAEMTNLSFSNYNDGSTILVRLDNLTGNDVEVVWPSNVLGGDSVVRTMTSKLFTFIVIDELIFASALEYVR